MPGELRAIVAPEVWETGEVSYDFIAAAERYEGELDEWLEWADHWGLLTRHSYNRSRPCCRWNVNAYSLEGLKVAAGVNESDGGELAGLLARLPERTILLIPAALAEDAREACRELGIALTEHRVEEPLWSSY